MVAAESATVTALPWRSSPTSALPGSAEKLAVMQSRAALGVSSFTLMTRRCGSRQPSLNHHLVELPQPLSGVTPMPLLSVPPTVTSPASTDTPPSKPFALRPNSIG